MATVIAMATDLMGTAMGTDMVMAMGTDNLTVTVITDRRKSARIAYSVCCGTYCWHRLGLSSE